MGGGEVLACPTVRCAVYTRKSTEEGLDQAFNSLDAQRESAESYIASQRGSGWILLPERYDDGGYSGANLERPALRRLLADMESGKIDCVLIYKVDRLSRSLFDFARLMAVFEKHKVSFVSVTQQLNSNTPMGRLTLNVLLSFAQFEREIISERTRDKKSAARRKGKWMGGYLVLGYDCDANTGKLVVNPQEAEKVRQIFHWFLQHGRFVDTLTEMRAQGWGMKQWITAAGRTTPPRAFNRPALIRLLSNVLYCGKVSHKGEIYPGEQEAIVDEELFARVQQILRDAERGRRQRRGSMRALLRGLLFCSRCGEGMKPAYTARQGRRYDYYACTQAQKKGASVCPDQSVNAEQIETAVCRALWQEGLQNGDQKIAMMMGGSSDQWKSLDEREQRQRLESVVQRIHWDGRTEECRIELKRGAWNGHEERVILMHVIRGGPGRRTRRAVEEERLPLITKQIALAVRLEELLQQRVVRDYAELARVGGVSRARITQIMNLRSLAPPIQEWLLLGAEGQKLNGVTERAVRKLAQSLDWREQMRRFEEIAGHSNLRPIV